MTPMQIPNMNRTSFMAASSFYTSHCSETAGYLKTRWEGASCPDGGTAINSA
jgi:hypothetical protein